MGNKFGAYYTPKYLASFLARWAVRSPSDSVLDPACGDGAILEEASTITKKLTGIDIDQAACRKLQTTLPCTKVVNQDFFNVKSQLGKFDSIVSNPPFIRYQLFEHSNGLSSSWLPFLKESLKHLSNRGRLAFIVPREILFANYSRNLLKELGQKFNQVTILIINFYAFNAQTRVVLLLCDSSSKLKGFYFQNIYTPDELNETNLAPKPAENVSTECLYDLISHDSRKIFDKLAYSDRFANLSNIAQVKLGIVTGGNDFFLLSKNEAKKWQIPGEILRPAISSPQLLSGAKFTNADLNRLHQSDIKCLLLSTDSEKHIESYIRYGEANKIHKRFKCSIRSPWFSIKTGDRPDAFLTYMVGRLPRLVLNEAGALCTNNLHAVFTGHPQTLTASFYNWVTMLSIELLGRFYGGGVLKIEPRDSARILVPADQVKYPDIDQTVRGGAYIQAIDEISNRIGLNKTEIDHMKQACLTLQDARNARLSHYLSNKQGKLPA